MLCSIETSTGRNFHIDRANSVEFRESTRGISSVQRTPRENVEKIKKVSSASNNMLKSKFLLFKQNAQLLSQEPKVSRKIYILLFEKRIFRVLMKVNTLLVATE